jgi:hypothetical protein
VFERGADLFLNIIDPPLPLFKAPLFVEALSKVTNDQVVNFSVVHKRPTFIIRNDRLTLGNIFVASDGIHFQFTKLFAVLEGDYEASAEINKAFSQP